MFCSSETGLERKSLLSNLSRNRKLLSSYLRIIPNNVSDVKYGCIRYKFPPFKKKNHPHRSVY